MNGLVTVLVGSEFPLRVMDAGGTNSIELGPFAIQNDLGVMEMKSFKDEMNQDASLMITGFKNFSKGNPIDRHNLAMLGLFLAENPEWKKDLIISDPEEEIEAEFKLSTIAFEVESWIRQNQKNSVLLAKLYRRIIGPAKGITDIVVINTLTALARTNPEKFQTSSGQYIYIDRSFEVLSLIDSSVEKGLLSIDVDGTIKDKDGRIFAQDIYKAAFYLEGDDTERTTLERLVSDKGEQFDKYVPIIETSEYAEFKVDSSRTDVSAYDGSVQPEVLFAEIKANVPKLVAAGFFERIGQGAMTKYKFDGIPGTTFTRTELAEHFVKNPKQYEDLKNRANL